MHGRHHSRVIGGHHGRRLGNLSGDGGSGRCVVAEVNVHKTGFGRRRSGVGGDYRATAEDGGGGDEVRDAVALTAGHDHDCPHNGHIMVEWHLTCEPCPTLRTPS